MRENIRAQEEGIDLCIRRLTDRSMARAATGAISVSVLLMVFVGILGPSAVVPTFPAASPWPPWFINARPSSSVVVSVTWLALLLGAAGLLAGLVATRWGWRPKPAHVIAWSVVAVTALMLIAPIGSADMISYAEAGRILTLGHSPYVMMPAALKSSGDPVGAVVSAYLHEPTRFGPIATILEAAASKLAGASAARTIYWLKVWNALAYLGIVLVLDRSMHSDSAGRVRAHLLWSVNPLMLWAAMAGGHNDVLAMGFGVSALFALRRYSSRTIFLSGVLIGLAAAIKVPYVLFSGGAVLIKRRSPLSVVYLALGMAAILVPSYLLAGRVALSASLEQASTPPIGYVPWFAVVRILGWSNMTTIIDGLGVLGSAILALIFLWRMPTGSADFPVVRIVLALALAWLIISPQQLPWYDIMIFPLLGMIPASRLDWIVIARAVVGAVSQVPLLVPYAGIRPTWLAEVVRIGEHGFAPVALTVICAWLLWQCFTKDWGSWPDPGKMSTPQVVQAGIDHNMILAKYFL